MMNCLICSCFLYHMFKGILMTLSKVPWLKIMLWFILQLQILLKLDKLSCLLREMVYKKCTQFRFDESWAVFTQMALLHQNVNLHAGPFWARRRYASFKGKITHLQLASSRVYWDLPENQHVPWKGTISKGNFIQPSILRGYSLQKNSL